MSGYELQYLQEAIMEPNTGDWLAQGTAHLVVQFLALKTRVWWLLNALTTLVMYDDHDDLKDEMEATMEMLAVASGKWAQWEEAVDDAQEWLQW